MAYTFDGNNYLMQPRAVVAAMPMTMACWLNLAVTVPNQVIMAVASSTSGHSSFCEMVFGGSGGGGTMTLSAGIGNDAGTVTDFTALSAATLSPGVWYHCAVVFSSATLRTVFLNGANSGTSTVSVSPGAFDSSYIGAVVHGANLVAGPVGGSIAFPAFWNVALSPGDITSLALGEGPIHEHPDNLASYIRCVGLNPEPDLVDGSSWTLVLG